jgi:hypothetical protein
VNTFLKELESLAAIDFEAERDKEEGTIMWFKFCAHTDEVMTLDLSVLHAFVLQYQ